MLMAATAPGRTVNANSGTPTEVTEKTYIRKAGTDRAGTSISGQRSNEETFVVDEGARKDSAGLDPRAEADFGGFYGPDDDITFTGKFDIKQAKDTTFFQLLDFDGKSSDLSRPVVFLEAETFVNDNGVERVRLFDRSQTGRRGDDEQPFYTGGPKFDFEFNSTDGEASFTVTELKSNGRAGKTVDRSITLDRFAESNISQSQRQQFERENEEIDGIQVPQRSKVRYGIYHHDRENISQTPGTSEFVAASRAEIVVEDAKLVLNNG